MSNAGAQTPFLIERLFTPFQEICQECHPGQTQPQPAGRAGAPLGWSSLCGLFSLCSLLPFSGPLSQASLGVIFIWHLGPLGLLETTSATDFLNLTPFLGGPFQHFFPVELARCLLLPVSCSLLFPARLQLLGGQRSCRGGKEPGTKAWTARLWAVPAPRPSLTARGLPLACILSACPPCPVAVTVPAAWHAEDRLTLHVLD